MWTYAFLSLGHILRCGIVRLCANPVLHWLRTATLSQAGHTILHSQKHHMRAPFSPHPGQHWPLSTLSLEVLLGGLTWYRTLDLAFSWCLRASLHVEMKMSVLCLWGRSWLGFTARYPPSVRPCIDYSPERGRFCKDEAVLFFFFWSCTFIVPPCPMA